MDRFAQLRRTVAGEVDDSTRRRAEYATDASNYRVVPAAVVFPRTDDDVHATFAFAAGQGLPLTARGGGTSVAGNAIGPGIVLDFSRHMNAVVRLDAESRRAVVQPGLVLAELQRAAAPHGLRFGPDPSTQNRCTLGGMIGNNACGPRAVAWGRTSDNVDALRAVDGTGVERTLAADLNIVPGLDQFVRTHLAVIRRGLGRFDRQASGYALEHLLPERGTNIAKALVGSEGTCGITLEATVTLVPLPAATAVAVLGYPDMATAAESAGALLSPATTAVEGLDARLVDVVRAHGRPAPPLPRGHGWLFVEVAAATTAAAADIAGNLAASAAAIETSIVTDPAEAAALWRIRADGAGLSGRTRRGEPAWPGWEDAAVPRERLGAYLRDFEALMGEHDVDGLLYGHFGDGCVHVRLDFPIANAPQRFRAFLIDAAKLVAAHGGSLSGEHGDGRARSELLPLMYSGDVLAAFAGFKDVFDPHHRLNPGVVVDPAPVDGALRVSAAKPVRPVGGFALDLDRGDLSMAVHRCVGVGKCRADGGFMCPSFQATRDEKDSTRGRARVLQEAVNGSLVRDGWAAAELADSLDLCLSCKACAADCPAGIDMATYKSETLYRRYKGKRRPASHYALGQLPRWLRAGRRVPRLVNALGNRAGLATIGLRAAGVDPRRRIPQLAQQSFRRWWKAGSSAENADVALWLDTFTDTFAPEAAKAAIALLESAGHRVRVLEEQACCGLTWITTGQLDGARRQLRRTLEVLDAAAGLPVIVLEPSCAAVLRTDVGELLPNDPRTQRVSNAIRTLAEFLTETGFQPPDLTGVEVVVQPHCHHHGVLGFDADRALLARTGASITTIAGCCGLAGNFGMEAGHYDVSVAVAENGLLPALRAHPDAIFVADGFSCRTQADQLAGRRGIHLADLLRRS